MAVTLIEAAPQIYVYEDIALRPHRQLEDRNIDVRVSTMVVGSRS